MELEKSIGVRPIISSIVLVTTLLVIADRPAPIESAALQDASDIEAKAQAFLKNYGYIETSKHGASSITPEKQTEAIMEYQEFYGLNQTGALDEETVQSMEAPRCGNPDKLRQGESASSFVSSIPRRKRQIEFKDGDRKWRRVQLTYKVWNYPKLFSTQPKEVDLQLQKALSAWSVVSPFDFTKTEGEADINIKWAVRKHCNGGDFDGPRGTLAHAFFPEIGKVHFDDDENWSITGMEKGKIDLYTVAVHEFGHTLGIEHKKDKRSLMFPTYGATDKLHEIDNQAIQAIYGTRQSPASPPPKPPARPPNEPPAEPPNKPPAGPPSRKPNLCKDSSIDAITMSLAGKVFVFKGDWYWLLNDEADGIVSGFPRPISKDWDGLPGNLDAALTFRDSRMYFFKGNQYWRYTNRQLDAGYPRMMSYGFPGIPDNVDGAFIWKNGKIFFFKGDQYWRFDFRDEPKVKANYPESITSWRGVPASINDVFLWKNGRTFFFKDENYYKYNDEADEVEQADPPFPRSASLWWFGCEENLSNGMLDGVEDSSDGASSQADFPDLEANVADFQSGNSTQENLNEPSLDPFE